MAKITTTVTAEVDSLTFTLTDGRSVNVLPSGHVYVTGKAYGQISQEYSFTLPTLEEVAQKCDETDDNEITFPVHHRH